MKIPLVPAGIVGMKLPGEGKYLVNLTKDTTTVFALAIGISVGVEKLSGEPKWRTELKSMKLLVHTNGFNHFTNKSEVHFVIVSVIPGKCCLLLDIAFAT